jgi:hypothetical protein
MGVGKSGTRQAFTTQNQIWGKKDRYVPNRIPKIKVIKILLYLQLTTATTKISIKQLECHSG